MISSDERVDALSAALHGRHAAAVEWLLTPPTRCRLDDADAIVAALHAGDTDLIRLLLHPRSFGTLRDSSVRWFPIMRRALGAVQDSQHLDLFGLLFKESFPSGVSLEDISDAIWSKHRFFIKYALERLEGAMVLRQGSILGCQQVLLAICMMGDRQLLEDAWRLFLGFDDAKRDIPEFQRTSIRLALQLCTNDDLTPIAMVLINRYTRFDGSKHPLLLAAMYGNLPCVKLWLAHGACPRLALPLAVKHQQHEVVAYLRRHGGIA